MKLKEIRIKSYHQPLNGADIITNNQAKYI